MPIFDITTTIYSENILCFPTVAVENSRRASSNPLLGEMVATIAMLVRGGGEMPE
jgi:hypothetical protein